MNNSQSEISSLPFAEKLLIYRGLLALVEGNFGFGFCNNDQGHPAYGVGRGGDADYEQWGDSPNHNLLFKMMHALSVELSAAETDNSAEISNYVFCWSDFCSLAYSAYERYNSNTNND